MPAQQSAARTAFKASTPILPLSILMSMMVVPHSSYAESQSIELGLAECQSLQKNDTARLACYDELAQKQSDTASRAPLHTNAPPQAGADNVRHSTTAAAIAAQSSTIASNTSSHSGCRDSSNGKTSQFWELDAASDCGNFRFRGYRPTILAVSWSNRVNDQPYSPSPDNGLAPARDYQHHEARLQLSLRTKLASNILTSGHGSKRDSLWFGYTLQAYWQAFNGELSRPFRNTDHEPEFVYIYPLEWQLPAGARLRYAGLGLNHQSNGQSNPLSRSWNRLYAIAGLDVTPSMRLTARLNQRINESSAEDDNPNISDYIGRGEFNAAWDVTNQDTLVATVRHSLRSHQRGSARLEWYRTLGESFAGGKSNLRFYASLFSGYGDSLIDYNYRRTTFTVGLSLLDF